MASSTTAVNSGLNCSLPVSECKHGTLVGGVIAGNGATYSGVAKDATLISLNVYSRFENPEICGDTTPCVMSFLSDQVRALERVYDIRNQYNIAAVNFSISGRKYTAACDSESSLLSDSIRQLAELGIPTITPTGNNGYSDGTGMPACMKWSISVGATEMDPGGLERIYANSNSAPFIHLLAPGGAVTSSVPGGGFETWAGTSIATPHVAGAWALLKQRLPSASIATGLRALAETGVRVIDNRNGLVKPRIKVDLALRALSDKAPEIEGYTFSIGTPMDRDPFKMTITGNKFEFNATRLYFCMVGTSTCVEHPISKVRVMAPTSIDADSIALASGTWNLYLETVGGASGRSKPFSVMAPPPPPTIDSYSWTPVNPRANQTFSGAISGNGFSVDGTKVYFCLSESSICSLLPNTNVIVNSETRLTINGVTLNAGTWQAYVQTSYGASPRSVPFKIEPAILPPTLSAFAWNPATPGENQPFNGVLTGTNFVEKETKVYFCISTLTTCSVLADSDVTVNTPTSLSVSNVLLRAGTWQLYVQTPGGASPRSSSFTIQAQQLQPSIATYIWNPARPTENLPFSGTISGTNFIDGGTQVFFCETGTTNCTPVASANIKVNTLTSLTVSNITLRSGSWQCYVSTPAGASQRSESFQVVPSSQLPVVSNVSLSTTRPTAFQPFTAVVSGANFVPGNTRVFFCPENSQNCQQQTTGVNALSSTSVSISNITLASGAWQLYLQTSAGNSNRSNPFIVEAALLPPSIAGYTLNPSNPRTNEPFTASLSGANYLSGNTQVFVCVSGTSNCAPVADGKLSIVSTTGLTLTNIRLDSGTWQFYVQTPGGISGRSLPFTIQTAIATPTIASQSWNPQVLVANQAASVTISGAGFAATGTQAFVCVAGTETCFPHPTDQTIVNSPTSLTLNGVFLLAGSWEMYIQTPLGKSERTAAFTVRAA
ncbi:MAG: S8 family peptidase, partial [Acidobacteriota bacterium]